MLRVIASRNAKEYFAQSLKREDYYSEGQEVSGDWHGMAAVRLGLSGAVDERGNLGAVTITVPVLSEFVKLRLARLEADQQRGIPFNEAIGNDALGLDIMARGVLQDWLATMFNQYDQIAAKLLPTVEAASIKPKIVPPIGEPLSTKRGAKVNLTN